MIGAVGTAGGNNSRTPFADSGDAGLEAVGLGRWISYNRRRTFYTGRAGGIRERRSRINLVKSLVTCAQVTCRARGACAAAAVDENRSQEEVNMTEIINFKKRQRKKKLGDKSAKRGSPPDRKIDVEKCPIEPLGHCQGT